MVVVIVLEEERLQATAGVRSTCVPQIYHAQVGLDSYFPSWFDRCFRDEIFKTCHTAALGPMSLLDGNVEKGISNNAAKQVADTVKMNIGIVCEYFWITSEALS